ncbi:MAG: hypothetical protein COB36_11600 [Alphaproteobacteria bacterium]|nr:MAG: hypothetical protein COB36_11600 [Alphaproteobacteria bacterium]
MAVLTQADIRQRVAKHLKIIASGQGLRATDGETIDNALVDVLASLKRGSFVQYDITAIPDYAAIPLVLLVGALAAHGVNAANPNDYAVLAKGAEPEIRRLEYEHDEEERGEPELYI